MKSSKEFPMPPFLIAQIGALYLGSHRACGSRFREQDFPLDFDQVPVLLLLHYGGAVSQQEIYTKLQRDKASVNRTVASLTKKGFATVKPDSEDKRKTIVELTTLGKNLAKQGNAIVEKYDNMLSSRLTTKELQLFSDLIGKLNIQS